MTVYEKDVGKKEVTYIEYNGVLIYPNGLFVKRDVLEKCGDENDIETAIDSGEIIVLKLASGAPSSVEGYNGSIDVYCLCNANDLLRKLPKVHHSTKSYLNRDA